MNRFAAAAVSLTTVTALAGSALVMTAGAAHADQEREREFRCHGADVDFQVEKDDRRFEVDVDLDDARPGSKWRVRITHDGRTFHNRVHRADSDGEIDIDRRRKDTRGKDAFKVSIKPVGAKRACTSRVVLR